MTAGLPTRTGRISLHRETLILCLEDRTSRLTRKTVDVLLALERAKGEPVGRDDLMQQVWRETVVEDAALKQHIYMLRGAFRELDPGSDYIVTVPHRGYRLAIPIEVNGITQQRPIAITEPVSPPQPPLKPSMGKSWRLPAIAVAVSALLSIGWYGQRKWRAWHLTGQGFEELRQRRGSDLTRATSLFQDAAQIDPGRAEAYAGLAQIMARHNKTVAGHALTMAERALKIDPNCGLCLSTRGWILFTREWKLKEAGADFERGVLRDPHFLEGRIWRAQFLAASRRFDEAKREIDHAVELAPTVAPPYAMRAGIYYLAGEYERAIDEAVRALAIQPRLTSALDWLYRASIQLGRHEDALYYWVALDSAYSDFSTDVQYRESVNLRKIKNSEGLDAALDTLLAKMSGTAIHTQRYQRAVWKMWKGDGSGALEELNEAAISRPFHLIYVAADPVFTPLRSDARFARLLKKLGFTALD